MPKRESNSLGRLTVNYKQKIETLKRNGILNEDQAQRLSNSLKESSNTQTIIKRKYTLEMVGALLLLLAGVYIILLVGMGSDASIVENTAKTLNSPIDSGLHPVNSFMMLLLFITLFAYLLLYLLAHNRYNALKNLDEQKQGLYQLLHNSEVMKVELNTKINTDTQKIQKEYLIEFYAELEEEILSYKNQLAFLETKCLQQQNSFPNTLARLVGKPPQCK
jgi:hypothetical protein